MQSSELIPLSSMLVKQVKRVPSNALSAIRVLSGIHICLRLTQPLNANFPMVFMLSGIFISLRLVQPAKAYAPIVFFNAVYYLNSFDVCAVLILVFAYLRRNV